MAENKEIIRQVGDIYKWLDEQLISQNALAGVCSICGKCCDFQTYDHRLYVTTPEMTYFADKLAGSNVIASDLSSVAIAKEEAKQSQTLEMTTGRCPYQQGGKCTVHPYRFAGCRIFCCKGDPAFQSELTEAVIKKFKAICEKFQIPYRYVDLPTVLNTFSPPHT